jgi:uncharacterized lipoprotein YddW (UPF0748 family)
MNKVRNIWLFRLFLLAVVGVFAFSNRHVKAAEDGTKPKISIQADNTSPTNDKIKISIKATDASGISSMKWAVGDKSTDYFKKYGKKLTLTKSMTKVSITKNGIYTFYAKDKAGNVRIVKKTITNIDTTAPIVSIKKNTSEATNQDVKLMVTLGDEGLGITSVKYLIGKKYETDFVNTSKGVKFTETSVVEDELNNNQYQYSSKITVKSNNIFTFLIEDAAGNKTLKRVSVDNIDKASPTIVFTPNILEPTNRAVIVKLAVTDEGAGVKEVVYLPGSKELEDFVNAVEPESDPLPSVVKMNTKGQGSFTVSNNGKYSALVTDKAGNQTLQIVTISNIDLIAPTVALEHSVMNQAATIVAQPEDLESGIANILYLKGNVTDINDEKWNTKGKDVTQPLNFLVKSSGNYSVLVEDLAGNKAIQVENVQLELKAVWISYLEFLSYGKGGFTEDSFINTVDTMFDNVVDLNMNAVVVQIRPFGDAMYDSSYFPWSKYISGTQGDDPGFDPLEYMVEAAHERDLEFHAWLNPYRVTLANTDYSSLSEDNPARVWYEDDDESNDRNVLSFDGNLYYNPASKEVQTLITNGVKEIVRNYEVDGIHFDDYFYPVLGTKYASRFDCVEYVTYLSECKADDIVPVTIANWRRNNVNTLVKNIYKSIKKIDSTVQFGISPGGFIDSLFTDAGYYVDIKTWLSSNGYIDYICPQIYWTFSNSKNPYDTILNKWLSYRTSSTVKMYVGIANYRAGSSLESDWKNDDEVLKNQIEYGRDTGLVDGFIFFRYDYFYNKVTKPGVEKLLEIL